MGFEGMRHNHFNEDEMIEVSYCDDSTFSHEYKYGFVFFSEPLLTVCYIAVTAHACILAGIESCIWCKYLYPPPPADLKTFF